MTASWDIRADSPLLPIAAERPRRARFSLPVPTSDEPPPPVEGLLAGAAEVDITPPPGHAQGRVLGQRPRRHAGSAPACGPGSCTCGRARRRWRSCSATCSAGRRSCSTSWPGRSPTAPTCPLAGCSSAPPTPTPDPASSWAPTSTTGSRRTGRASTRRGPSSSSTRIADGVIEAVDDPPAGPAWPWGRAEVWGLTRNRSLDPHVRNATVADRRTEPQRKFVAVNPVAAPAARSTPRRRRRPRAAGGAGGVLGPRHRHPDAVPRVQRRPLGLPRRRARPPHRAARTARRPVVGAIEGTHADVAPGPAPGDGRPPRGPAARPRHRRRGRRALRRARRASCGPTWRWRAGLREVDLERVAVDRRRRRCRAGRPSAPRWWPAPTRTSRRSSTGSRRSAPGIPKPWRPTGPQGGKWVIGSPLAPAARPAAAGRSRASCRAGAAHRRPRARRPAVRDHRRVGPAHRAGAWPAAVAAGDGVEQVVVSSVANEYSGYVRHPRGVRPPALRGRPHALRPAHPAVPGRPRRASWRRRSVRAGLRPTCCPTGPSTSASAATCRAVRRRRPPAP